jgi:hypothetical protein
MFLAAGMLLAAQPAVAANPKLETTADLVAFCDTIGPVEEVQDGQSFCAGFIAGSGLLYRELVRAGKMRKVTCADPAPTLDEAREAFVAWANENQEHMSSRPIDGLWRAMAETYPCPK